MAALLLFVPFLLAAVVWIPFVALLRRGRHRLATTAVALWALALMVGLPLIERSSPGLLATMFPGAGRYGARMMEWVGTGVGCESSPTCFVPQQLVHAGVFVVGAVATAGLLGLVLAAVLFGWMGAYAGSLAAASSHPLLAMAAAWHPWALVRVAAYLVLGVALAEPLAGLGVRPTVWRTRWLVAGAVGLLLDMAMKALLAPAWWQIVVHPLLQP